MTAARLLLSAIFLLALAGKVAHADTGVAGSRAGDQSLLFLQSLDQRVANVSWKLVTTNVALCPNRMNAIGISVHNSAQYAPAYRSAAIATFGFGDGLPAILAIAKDGPANAAGLRAGDRIAGIDGTPQLPHRLSSAASEDYAPIAAVTARLEQLPGGRPIPLDVLRDGKTTTLTVKPVVACLSRIELVPSGEINANSNGLVVQIYGKLALWTKSDDELAIVIAHEMAHNILDHNRRIESERIGTGLFSSFGGDGRKLRDMEREADRYGLYLAARAGYDYRLAPDFWRRLSNTKGIGAVWATTHPTGSNRAAFNQGVVAEIEAKKAAGGDLTP